MPIFKQNAKKLRNLMANGLPPEKPLYTSKNTYPKSKIPKKIFAAPSDKFILTDLNDAEWILIMG